MRNETLQLWFDIGCLESYLAAVCFSLVTDKCKKRRWTKNDSRIKTFYLGEI